MAVSALILSDKSSLGQIYYNSASPLSGQVIPGTQGITPGPGIDLSGWNTPGHQLEFASLSYQGLSNASFENSDLTSASLYFSDLTNADFRNANLTRANAFQLPHFSSFSR